jgi:hypothetical protein
MAVGAALVVAAFGRRNPQATNLVNGAAREADDHKGRPDTPQLLEVRTYHVDQFFSRMSALRIGLISRINEVRANMILHDLGHQPVDGAAGAGNELQHVSTTDFLIERPFDGFDLSANASHAIEEFGLFANGVGH